MKKNRMMRLASGLLVAVLLSTCAISGTYAKYVTSSNAGDSARVAKWGVTFTAQSDLFQTSYTTDDTDYTGMSLSVKSSDTKNVVAPGTAGTGYSFATNGTPEVSYRVTFATTKDTTPETVFLGSSDKYYPVVFTLKFNNSAVTISTQAISDVLAAVANCTYYFDVNDAKYYVSTDGGANWGAAQDDAPALELSWAWDFDDNGAGTNDVKDTALGNLAAGMAVTGYSVDGTDYNLDVAFDITATATQIN